MHIVPQFEPEAFAVEETGDTGTFVVDTTKLITKLYNLGVDSDEDSLPFLGICLHLSLVALAGSTSTTLTLALAGSLDGTTADSLAPGGTFRPSYTITGLVDANYELTRTWKLDDDGIYPYVAFTLQTSVGDSTFTATATAKRFRLLSAAG